jgi:hypothetical protein
VLNNVLFQVIGIMAARGASPQGQDQDDVVMAGRRGGLRDRPATRSRTCGRFSRRHYPHFVPASVR